MSFGFMNEDLWKCFSISAGTLMNSMQDRQDLLLQLQLQDKLWEVVGLIVTLHLD